MSVVIALAALALLMLAAYRGYSVILFAPIAAMGAVLLTDPSAVAPAFTGIFMEKMVGFIKLYFPVFLLGAVFGKLIEMSGFSRSIVAAAIRLLGTSQAMLVIVLVCALLTYGGVSLFVVVFAVYPFAAEMFRQSNMPKRLIPATIALGAFTFTMTAIPGTPQIQNIIPTTFFNTNTWAAPWLGLIGTVFVFGLGMLYLKWQLGKAIAAGEGYGTNLRNEPETPADIALPNPWLALSPLLLVLVAVFGSTLTTVTIAVGVVSWPAPARLTRAEFLSLRNREFVQAGKTLGMKDLQLILGEILPNALPPVIVYASVVMAVAILLESALAFLRLSDPNVASWGNLIGLGRDVLRVQWYVSAIPGIAILVTVLAVSLVGQGLNDALNPRLKSR